MAMPLVSVVVPSYRPGSLLEDCVEALFRQEFDHPFEVIVVESSGDGTAERLCARFPACRVIALAQRAPQAVARNLGVAEARGRYVALTDHDCVVSPDWLARFLTRHATGCYAAVAGAVVNGTPWSAVGTAAYWIEFNDFTPGRATGLVKDVPHCNTCFRREALDGPGPFPAIRSYAEDLTFNYLLTSAGGTIYFDPTIVVTHMNRTRLHEYLAHQRALGTGSAVSRRLVPLAGGVFVHHPSLVPLLPVVRLGRTLARVARRHPDRTLVFLTLLPLLLLGYVAWTRGFLDGRCEALPIDPVGLPATRS